MWTDLIKMKAAARWTKDRKFIAVFSQRNAIRLNLLSLPTPCSMRARALYKALGKKAGLVLTLDLWGMTGAMLRFRAASRLALLSYPLSPIAARGSALGPRSSRIGNCGASPFSPPVRSKAR